MEKVVAGEWQIVMLSPEMLLSRRFIDGVLRKSAFGSCCLSVFIDEAHCISHWGASFRKKYASIGIIRAFLPRTTPIIAVTATLTPRVHQDLIVKLQFDPKNYVFCNIGNDRPNVSQIIRSMEHPANSYRDIDFMVDPEAEPKDIKLSFLYSDDIADGGKLVDHLNGQVNPAYRSRGLVRPYNAGMSREYRAHVMALFKAGIVRILVCTDAAGMGCDMPNVELVVQWKLPNNLSSWIQRPDALLVVLACRCLLVHLRFGGVAVAWQGIGGRGGSGRRGGKNQGKDYAESHGQKRGWYRGVNDGIKALEGSDTEIPVDAPAEGLYAVVQATICRRIILSRIFKNAAPTHAILDDATCELLSSIGPVEDIATLEQLLKSSWSRWDELGNRLYVYMHGLDIPPLPPPPTRKKTSSAALQPSTSSIPQSAPAAPHIGQPSQNTTATAKRRHAEHGTRFDDSAPPAQRSRIEHTLQTPLMPRPTPRPAYRGFASQPPPLPLPSTSLSYSSPLHSSPSSFATPARLPATPAFNLHAYSHPSPYPAQPAYPYPNHGYYPYPTPTQMSSPIPNTSPFPSNISSNPYFHLISLSTAPPSTHATPVPQMPPPSARPSQPHREPDLEGHDNSR
ncbi:P-loop containing nucleoside triphosphate hydrolase protein [Mycena leptocephala]|nr:P-loop containing nucleoside triphosphate hydrolase protein [Mycena leptocephala]